jgi:hypothetical protein
MKLVLLLTLLLATDPAAAHGSSHPRWEYKVDAKGVEYMQCSDYRVSQAPRIYERRIITHFFKLDEIREYMWVVNQEVAFAEFNNLMGLRGERCHK